MDRTIEKCRKSIKLHSIKSKPKRDPKRANDPKYKLWLKSEEFNANMDLAWIRLGEAEFHKGDFLGYLCSRFCKKCYSNSEIMLKEILAITGKPGLYKLVSRGNNMLIVESLVDGKRMPTYARDKIVALSDVSMFTNADDVALWQVLTNAGKKEGLKPTTIDAKKASNTELQAWFDEVLPDWDRDRVYPSDIRKLIQWYNILVKAGITDFQPKEEEAE